MEGHDIKQVGITVKLDKERRLLFDLNAFCELEEKYGNISNAMNEIKKGSMKSIRYMLYLGLLNEDEKLTEKGVGKLINTTNLNSVMQTISTAVTLSSPEADKKN